MQSPSPFTPVATLFLQFLLWLSWFIILYTVAIHSFLYSNTHSSSESTYVDLPPTVVRQFQGLRDAQQWTVNTAQDSLSSWSWHSMGQMDSQHMDLYSYCLSNVFAFCPHVTWLQLLTTERTSKVTGREVVQLMLSVLLYESHWPLLYSYCL